MSEYEVWCKQRQIVNNEVNRLWTKLLKESGYDPNINVCSLPDHVYEEMRNIINTCVSHLFLPPFNFPVERNGCSIGWNYKKEQSWQKDLY